MNKKTEQALESRLTEFQSAHPPEGAALRHAIAQSPEIRAALSSAIEKDHLDRGFGLLSEKEAAYTVARYDDGPEQILMRPSLLIESGVNPRSMNTLIKVLGHEVQHSIHQPEMAAIHDRFKARVHEIASGNGPRDYTGPIADLIAEARPREAADEIEGFNMLAAKIKREHPDATTDQLYKHLHGSCDGAQSYIRKTVSDSQDTFSPRPGISFNPDTFQIEKTPENIEAFGKYFYDARGYPTNYGQYFANEAAGIDQQVMEQRRAAGEAIEGPAYFDLEKAGIPADRSYVLPDGWVNASAPAAPPRGQAPATVEEEGAKEKSAPHAALNTAEPVPLSLNAEQLLRDAERHVRLVAEKHGLEWDQGMENTVMSLAAKAREAGMTGITHFKSDGQQLYAAQFDGYSLRDTRVNAMDAANTPLAQSWDRLQQADQQQVAQSMQPNAPEPQMEMDARAI